MSVRAIEAEVSIKSGVQAECTIGREVIRTVYDEPVLESLSVTENGLYEPSDGVDGYSDVTVNVPGKIPVLEQLRVLANGEYYPAEGIDGFDEVLVDVPTKVKVRTGKYIPEETYNTAGNRQIVTVEQIGFTPTRFTLVVSDISSLNQYPKSIVRTSFFKVGDGENVQYAKVTTRYTDAGNFGNLSRLNDWNETYAGFLKLSNGVITYATAPNNYILLGGVEYTWYAWAEDAAEPVDPNVYEGEFIGTETGVLTIDTGYEGESFIRRLEIEPVSGFAKTDDGFLTSAPNYAMNTLLCISYIMQAPNYEGNTGRNRLRIFSCYKYSGGYSASQEAPYAYNAVNDPTYGTANVIKIPNNHQFKALMASAPQGSAGAFVPGIRYKYKVFY